MNWIKYPDEAAVEEAKRQGEPLLLLIAFDGETGIASHVDDAVEHHILLAKIGKDGREIDQYFRLVADGEGADWTFVCPPDYRGILDKTRRIAAFYKDGFAMIPKALQSIGLPDVLQIPKRYRSPMNFLTEE